MRAKSIRSRRPPPPPHPFPRFDRAHPFIVARPQDLIRGRRQLALAWVLYDYVLREARQAIRIRRSLEGTPRARRSRVAHAQGGRGGGEGAGAVR